MIPNCNPWDRFFNQYLTLVIDSYNPILQMNNKTTDGRDKSKLLLERLRMLEKENSSLVLENEQQRQQYEKCLDEIANQVITIILFYPKCGHHFYHGVISLKDANRIP